MFEKLQEVIAEKLNVGIEEIEMCSSFREDLGADSLDLFEVVMGIEEAFDITIDNNDLDKIQTVEDALNYITERK